MKKTASVIHNMKITDVSSVDRGAGEGVKVMLVKRAANYDAFLKAKYSAEDRRKMADSGEAMKDGSYPIKDAKDLENAIHAVGRGKNNSHTAIRAHIKSRAKALGLTDKLPDTYDKAFTISKRDLLDVEISSGSSSTTIAKEDASALTKIGLLIPQEDSEEEEADDFNEVLSERLTTDALQQNWWRGTDALYQSILSILNADDVSDKRAAVTESLQQFAEYVGANLPSEIGKALAAGNAAIAGMPGKTLEGEHMIDAIKKALGLPGTATEQEIVAAITKAVEDKAKSDKEACYAKMSDAHKKYMNNPKAKMPEGGKDAFAAMSAEDRAKHIKDNPVPSEDEEVEKSLAAGEAFKDNSGNVFRKRDFANEAAFDFAKSAAHQLKEQEEEIRKAKEDRAVTEFAKRATDAGCPAEFGGTLRKAYSGDRPAQTELERVLKSLRAQADEGKLFETFGKSGSSSACAADELQAKADEIKKSDPNLSDQQAFTKAYTDPANREIVKRYKAENHMA